MKFSRCKADFAIRSFAWLIALCGCTSSPDPAKSDETATDPHSSSDEDSETSTDTMSFDEQVTKLNAQTYADALAIDKIYCDCKNDLCSGLSASDWAKQFKCLQNAVNLDPEGALAPLKCDATSIGTELECLKKAKSCKEISMPPDDKSTCEELAQDVLQGCPDYPDEVQKAIEECPG